MHERALRVSCGLAPLALLAAALTSGSLGAKASDDHTATDAIEKMMAARSKEALAGRASPIEHLADAGTDDLRPQQSTRTTPVARRPLHGPIGVRVASLGNDIAPMSLLPEPGSVSPDAGRLPAAETGAEAAKPEAGHVVASLGGELPLPGPSTAPSLSGAPIRWVANAECLAAPLRAVLAEVAANFGPLRVNSTCRSKRHNARVGGAKRSYHLTGNAVDFRISGSVGAVHAFLSGKRVVGGLKHYGFGLFHIDTGPRRTWANKSRGNKSSRAKRRRQA